MSCIFLVIGDTNTTSTTIDLIFVNDKEPHRETGILEQSLSNLYNYRFQCQFSEKKSICAEFRSFKIFDEDNFLDELRNVPWHICKDIESIDLTWKI